MQIIYTIIIININHSIVNILLRLLQFNVLPQLVFIEIVKLGLEILIKINLENGRKF